MDARGSMNFKKGDTITEFMSRIYRFLHPATFVVFIEDDGWMVTNMTEEGMEIRASNEQ